ncbi:MAG: outer membrane lipoprotein carrier protein LolA [Sedimentitalea sp.]|nr:outer membrane lipoprotein carrier protein LolA [Sedimentitalea sp.]
MKQLTLGLALLLSVLLGSAARADGKQPLSAISAYLNGLTTAQATFTQINDDGSRSTGRLYIHRPGRMRFEYDPPDSAVVLAGAGAVVIRDPKSNQPPESYPLNRTPLSIILAAKVDLGRAGMVTGHGWDGNYTIVRAQDPDNPDSGSIDLMFSGDPVALDRWVVTDASGAKTTVILGALETGMRLDPFLFNTQAGSNRSNR